MLGYEPWGHYEDLIFEHIEELVAKQLNPKQIMLSTIDMLQDKKISTPSYDHFCKIISNHYRNFEQELISKLSGMIEDKHIQALDDLLDEGDQNKCKLLTNLKEICQSIATKKIKSSLHRCLIVKRTFLKISRAYRYLLDVQYHLHQDNHQPELQ